MLTSDPFAPLFRFPVAVRWVPEGDQGDGERQEGGDHALLHLRQDVIVAAGSWASMGGYTRESPVPWPRILARVWCCGDSIYWRGCVIRVRMFIDILSKSGSFVR